MKVAVIGCLLSIMLISDNSLTDKDIKWLRKQAHHVTKDYKQYDWSGLDQSLKNKNMVLLGESNHGTREIFRLKHDLIKYLNKNHGYRVLLLESGLAEMIPFIDQHPAASMLPEMKTAWRTQSHVDLLDDTDLKDINIAGFDVFKTGTGFAAHYYNHTQDSSIFQLENEFDELLPRLRKGSTPYDSVSDQTLALIEQYQILADQIQNDNTEAQLIQRALQNRADFLHYLLIFKKEKDMSARLTARDRIMYENITWLQNHIFPNQKIIVLTHTIHASRYLEHEEMMGEFMHKNFSDNILSLALIPGSGTYSDYTGKIKEVVATDSLRIDIKDLISTLPEGVNYLNLTTKHLDFLDRPVTFNDTFIDLKQSNQFIPSKCFDGLILVNQASIPIFVR